MSMLMVRQQSPQDAAAVADVVRAAFIEEPVVVELEAALQLRPDSAGYVAVHDDRVVGHVRLTRGWVDAPRALVEVLVLSPLSVHPDLQGRGIARRLLDHAVGAAGDAGAPIVLLEGDPDFYGRLGWRPASEWGITPPSERIPEPACQAIALTAYESWMRGRLVYADTFWAFDSVGLR